MDIENIIFSKKSNISNLKNMKIYAIYRVLYGEDFFKDSVESLIKYCDRIFLFIHDRPWGNKFDVNIYGKNIKYPKYFDNCRKIAQELKDMYSNKIIIINDDELKDYIIPGYGVSNISTIACGNSYLSFYNYIQKNYEQPNILLTPELDVVMDNNVNDIIKEFLKTNKLYGYPKCKFFYGHPQYQFKYKKIYGVDNKIEQELEGGRLGLQLVNCDLLDKIKLDSPHIKKFFFRVAYKMPLKEGVFLNYYCFNFGYCWNYKTMFWKLLVNLSQSNFDSPSDFQWYKEKYLTWTENTTNLEIAKGYFDNIPNTFKIDKNILPLSIQKRIDNNEFEYIFTKTTDDKKLEFEKWFNTLF